LPVVFYNLAPWSFFSPALAVFLYQRRTRLSLDGLQYLLVWFVAILAFYSLARGKRGIYMLLLYPAFALLFGAWWSILAEKQEAAITARWMGCVYVSLCTLVLLGIGLYIEDPASTAGRFRSLTRKLETVGLLQADGHDFAVNVKYSVAILSALIIFLAFSLWQKSWPAVFAFLTAIAVVQLMLMRTVYFPHFVSPRTFKPFMARVTQRIQPSTPLKFYRGFDAGAIFYADRHIREYEPISEPAQPSLLLMWEEDFDRLKARNNLTSLDISEGRGPALRHRLMLVEPDPNRFLVDTVAPHKSND
jgi:4-amino-4-deoxy-L-arabinose transferase-like glycosyltransferase